MDSPRDRPPIVCLAKGYGAFAVSPSNLERVRIYVINQEQHHSRLTFQEEYVGLLRASGVAYDGDICGESCAHL
ncbi:MAG TPA: hypothetical protein VFX97_11470 [Pyrinomonadaceae bacterium]|nr:hypothetical protein [Pyrinomonadaceae bacterium]